MSVSDAVALRRVIDEITEPMGLKVAGNGVKVGEDFDGFRVRLWPGRYVEFDLLHDEIVHGDGPTLVIGRIEDAVVEYAIDMLRQLPPELRAKAIAVAEDMEKETL